MNLAEDIKPISVVKARAAEIIAKIAKTHRPVIITQNGEAKAVLTDIETYSKMQDTLAMLKLVAMRQSDIAQNSGISHKDAKKQIREYLKDRLKR